MKAYEKEIIKAQLTNEKEVIAQLKELYETSLTQINSNIEQLIARYKQEELQSVIYQLDYQKALRTQISGILDTLQAGEYEKISDFLNASYENGFIGAMYSMQRQGVPLIIPMDQEQILNAIVHESKISKGLYEALGENVKSLKKRISSEVSRGIANNFSFSDIARNIRNVSTIGYNNAIRIARTEGHRIQGQAQLDSSHKAKEKGADVVKQWDSTLDGRTRKNHRKLDGQIRELDEYFEVGGRKAKCPGQFNRPEEDINCRCVMLQRARWGLDDSELKTLEERAKFHDLDKTKDFEDYKEKYLKAVKEEAKEDIVEKVNNVEVKKSDFLIREETFNGYDKTLINENINQINDLTNKFPKMQRFVKDNKFIIDGGSVEAGTIAYTKNTGIMTSDKSIQIRFSKAFYDDSKKLLEKEKKYSASFWNMPCLDENYNVYSATHEYGHAIHQVLLFEHIEKNQSEFQKIKQKILNSSTPGKILDTYEAKIIGKYLNEIKDIAKKSNPNLNVMNNLSKYGRTSPHEAFAEIFANSQCGEPNELGKAMNKWLEEVMK